MAKVSIHDRPRRPRAGQGKITNLEHAVEVGDLARPLTHSLPPREVTVSVIHASAAAPHMVPISAWERTTLEPSAAD